jgi:hypothetical protein
VLEINGKGNEHVIEKSNISISQNLFELGRWGRISKSFVSWHIQRSD